MLEKVERFAKIFALIGTPLAVAFLGTRVQQREVDVRLLELGTRVLMSADLDEGAPLRYWAREIINTYADVELSEEAAYGFSVVEWQPIFEGSATTNLYRALNADSIAIFYADTIRE